MLWTYAQQNEYINFVRSNKKKSRKQIFYFMLLFCITYQSSIVGSIHSKTTSAEHGVLCDFLIKSEDKR
jgi:hypothetical protein